MSNMKKKTIAENIRTPNMNTIEAGLKEMIDIKTGKREKKYVDMKRNKPPWHSEP